MTPITPRLNVSFMFHTAKPLLLRRSMYIAMDCVADDCTVVLPAVLPVDIIAGWRADPAAPVCRLLPPAVERDQRARFTPVTLDRPRDGAGMPPAPTGLKLAWALRGRADDGRGTPGLEGSATRVMLSAGDGSKRVMRRERALRLVAWARCGTGLKPRVWEGYDGYSDCWRMWLSAEEGRRENFLGFDVWGAGSTRLAEVFVVPAFSFRGFTYTEGDGDE